MVKEGFFSSSSSTPDAAPRDAATIVLLRERDGALQTLLLRRHRASGFMAGAYVFPGGKVDADDYAPETLARAPQTPAVDALNETPGIALTPKRRRGLYVAACRETFEEAGVLFARRRGADALITLDDDDRREALVGWREKLMDRSAGIGALLGAEDLELDLSQLVYFSHWITPSAEKRRFDTRFFVAMVPPGQTPELDRRETVEERWLSCEDALAQHADKEIFLPPPTQRTIEELSGVATFDDVRALAARRTIAPIMPKVTVIDGDITILLPWDPLYASTEGESFEAADPDPSAARPSRIAVKPLA